MVALLGVLIGLEVLHLALSMAIWLELQAKGRKVGPHGPVR